MPSLMKLLRSNSWSNDSYSGGDVFGTICARGDLNSTKPSPYGCMDAKVGERWSLGSTVHHWSWSYYEVSFVHVLQVARN